jgi:hypothetical protein
VRNAIGVLAALAGAATFDLSPGALPPAQLGRSYSGGPIVAAGGGRCSSNTVRFDITAGALPTGLVLSEAGYFRGVPSEPGVFRFVIRAANGCGWSTREFSIAVAGAPILLVNPPSVVYRVLAGQRLPEPEILRVSSDTPNLAYSVDGPPAAWVEARVGQGVTPAPGAAMIADTITLHLDHSRLTPGRHQTELVVSAWRAVDPVRVPIEVTVLEQRLPRRLFYGTRIRRHGWSRPLLRPRSQNRAGSAGPPKPLSERRPRSGIRSPGLLPPLLPSRPATIKPLPNQPITKRRARRLKPRTTGATFPTSRQPRLLRVMRTSRQRSC